MISIIVSSYKEDLFQQFSKNVSETIGVPFEIIQILNPGKIGICEAYNNGAEKAKYSCLCFSHEDILHRTKGWGQLVINHLRDKSIGLIGVYGGSYKSQIPGPAWYNGELYGNIIQHSEKGAVHQIEQGRQKGNIVNVVVIDGVFMCSTATTWRENKFHEKQFKSFHFYDMDFSLSVLKSGKKVCVVYDILLEHLSPGRNDKIWYLECVKAHKFWHKFLPQQSQSFSQNEIHKFENFSKELNYQFFERFASAYEKKIARLKLLLKRIGLLRN